MYSNGAIYVPDRKPPIGAVRNPYLEINQGIVGDWPMWEGAGPTVEDLSGNGNVPTFVGNPTWVSGQTGPALDFDGAGDELNFGDYPLNTTGWSIVYKIKFDSVNNSDHTNIVYKNFSIIIRRTITSSNWDTYIGDGAGWAVGNNSIPSAQIVNGVWYLSAHTYDGTLLKHYLDAVLKDTDTPDKSYGNNAIDFRMPSMVRSDFDGQIEFIYIFNRALSASEIAQLYREPFCGFRWMSIEQLAVYYEEAPPEIRALFMDLSTQLWTIKHATGIFTKL